MNAKSQQLTLAQLAEQQTITASKYQELVKEGLLMAQRAGADAAEIWCHNTVGNSIEVRNQELETLEFNQDSSLSLTLYFNQSKGSVSINDVTRSGIEKGVKAASDIARFTQADEYAGLAPKDRMATDIKDLELCHPSSMSIEESIEQAKMAESTALDNFIIKQSEGANIYGHCSASICANSHGFIAKKFTSRYSLSTTMIADSDSGMLKEAYYSVGRDYLDLEPAQLIGTEVSNRLQRRLRQGTIKAGKYPVVFTPETARTIWGHLLSALKGGALYQKSSFMLNKKDQKVLPSTVQIVEDPFILKGFGSGCYDSEGVATYKRDIVADGILKDYFLSSYSAKRLGLESTASAGGIHNILIGHDEISQTELIKKVGTGLLVTELMGQGVNIVTGNYSRGASGFWIENGEIKHFVQEITIAGNLNDMLLNIIGLANDIDHRSSILTGSMAIDHLIVASQ
ncbi:metalloprotease PmbA [Kangiella sp. HZ709]|uniref:metalloprotease PmbA n=1 Tax=Kangiella sp. HZ709 TaxID=2666328 RepID=UPI0012B0A871|nr:metalloprotease PmbA [Kangiella sp. HZ709]MRX27477.1 metalloprotease PmbA [Kangiella sp. HZ709]